jgi:hypothetical protein
MFLEKCRLALIKQVSQKYLKRERERERERDKREGRVREETINKAS